MGEKFGNYLCQKIVDYANEEEILKILENVKQLLIHRFRMSFLKFQ